MLANTLETSALDLPGERQVGKVRDSYRSGDTRVLVTTDRVSCFDRVVGTIPFKGQVLNQLAAFWFGKTATLASNHMIATPDPNVMVVRECSQLPLEFVVRGYLTGTTKTSIWHHYKEGVRDYCGNRLRDGMRKDQKLDEPILTPTTKLEEHDRPISRDEAIGEGLIEPGLFDAAAEICFKLFAAGVKHAAGRGLILVDTKYEIGRDGDRLVVSDEIHTPDSSRYWFADTYEELFEAGEGQRKIDKDFVREWLSSQGFIGDGTPPPLPDEIRMEAARRYIQVYELVTGTEFVPADGPIAARIETALSAGGYM
jgi:phosphoribosylaminoimidazole-succinocarboxamide synthase